MIDFKKLCSELRVLLDDTLPLNNNKNNNKETLGLCEQILEWCDSSAPNVESDERFSKIFDIVNNPKSILPDLEDENVPLIKECLKIFVKTMTEIRKILLESQNDSEQQNKSEQQNDSEQTVEQQVFTQLFYFSKRLEVFNNIEGLNFFTHVPNSRYPDMLMAAQHSMVYGKPTNEGDERPFHANKVPVGNTHIIINQAPFPTAIVDLWHACWEQESPVIVMLTKLVENNRQKAHPYWSAAKQEAFSRAAGFKVHTISTVKYKDEGWTVQKFRVEKEGESIQRYVTHLQYTEWPDRAAPTAETLEQIREFVHQQRDISKSELEQSRTVAPGMFANRDNEPDSEPEVSMMVHCSAGIGRAGTFVLAEILEQLDIDGLRKLSEHEVLYRVAAELAILRLYRHEAVQTNDQFHLTVETLQNRIDNANSSDHVCATSNVSGANNSYVTPPQELQVPEGNGLNAIEGFPVVETPLGDIDCEELPEEIDCDSWLKF